MHFHHLRIRSFGIQYRLLINGAPVFLNEETSEVSLDLPVQHWMTNGNNTLSIAPHATSEANLHPEANLRISVLLDPMSAQEPITTWHLTVDQLIESINKPEILKHTFSNRSNVTRPKWENANELKDTPELFNALFDAYQGLWKLLQNKDVDGLIRAFREKSADMAYGYNQTLGEYEDHLRVVYSDRFSIPGNVAWPLKRSDLTLKLYANNRLASLEASDGCSPLLLFNEHEMLCSYFDALFYQPVGETSYLIIR
jgi:hypothetical protein